MTKRAWMRRAAGAAAIAVAAAIACWAFQHARARRHWDEASHALQEGDAEGALDHLADCLAWWGDRPDVHLLAARAARLADRCDEAEGHLAACEGTLGGSDDAVARERALLRVQLGDFQAHLPVLARGGMADREPPPDVLVAVAKGQENTFRYQDALRSLVSVLRHDPDDVRGNLLAASVLVQMHGHDQALPHLERAVRRVPAARTPRLRLAETLLELGEVSKAGPHLAVLRAQWPDDAEVLLTVARWLDYRGEPDNAVQALEQLLDAQPNHVAALEALAQLDRRRRESRRALERLDRAVAVRKGSPDAWEFKAFCHEALAESDAACRARAELTRVRTELGVIRRLQLESDQAGLDDADRRLDIAARYERLGESVLATRWYLCILQIDADNGAAHRALAALYQAGGQVHLAAYHRTRTSR